MFFYDIEAGLPKNLIARDYTDNGCFGDFS